MQDDLFQKEYAFLNDAQRQAVDTMYWPVMVVAGPWTGKTQIIALRVANILQKTDLQANNILIITYTDAGVIAIKKRLQKILGSTGNEVTVSTFHGFCEDVKNSFSDRFTQYNSVYAMDEFDTQEIIESLFLQATKEEKIWEIKDSKRLADTIANLKTNGFYPRHLKHILQEQEAYYQELLLTPNTKGKQGDTIKMIAQLKDIIHVYHAYEDYLQNTQSYDFSDMIKNVLEVFQDDEELRYFYAEKYQCIMIDEFQDTNNAQNEIIKNILSVTDEPNILVVGDDDQSIYSFQGANLENMLAFTDAYPAATVITLTENYRSTQDILDVCQESIAFNRDRLCVRNPEIQKYLISHSLAPNITPKVYEYISPEEEKAGILQYIREKKQKTPLCEMAILVKSNAQIVEWTNFLQANDIGVISKSMTDILGNPYVVMLYRLLSILDDPSASDAELPHLIRHPIFGMDGADIFHILHKLSSKNYTRKYPILFFEFLTHLQDEDIILTFPKKIPDFLQLIYDLQAEKETCLFSEFLWKVIEDINLLEYIEKHGTFDDIQDVYSFVQKAQEFSGRRDFSLSGFLSRVRRMRESGKAWERGVFRTHADGVQILTAHGSKWLEFDYVIIPECQDSKWGTGSIREKNYKIPVKERDQDTMTEKQKKDATRDKKMEELRRLFFVVCSRAKRELVLSYTTASSTTGFLEEIKGVSESVSGSNLVGDVVFQDTIKRALRIDSVTADERICVYWAFFGALFADCDAFEYIFGESKKISRRKDISLSLCWECVYFLWNCVPRSHGKTL